MAGGAGLAHDGHFFRSPEEEVQGI